MNLSPSEVLDEYYSLLRSSIHENYLFGINEKGEKVKFEHKKWHSIEQTHRFTAVFFNMNHIEGGDVARLKRVLSNDTRLYIICGGNVPNDRLHIVLNLLESYKDNIVLIKIYIGDVYNIDDFIRDLLKLNLSCYFVFTDARKKMKLEKRLTLCIELYESNMKVLSFNLRNIPVISSSMPEWQRLKNLIQEKRDTVDAQIITDKVEADAAWLKNFLSSFSRRASLNVTNHKDMFRYALVYSSLQGKRSILIVRFKETRATVDELSAELVKVHNLALAEPTTSVYIEKPNTIEKLVLAAFLKSLEISTKIVHLVVTINDDKVNLTDYESGREILAILDSRYSAKVKELIESNKQGALNRTKLMVVGAGGAGKTSCCRALLGEDFVKEHLSTVVADGSRDLALLDAKDINISEAWQELPNGDEFYKRDFEVLKNNIIHKKAETGDIIEPQSLVNSIDEDRSINRNEQLNSEETTEEAGYRFEETVSKVMRKGNHGSHQVYGFDQDLLNKASDMKLTLWDFGGQAVFDTVHHFYLSNQGITLLVIDLREWVKNRKRAETSLRKWLASLVFYSKDSYLFIAGTRAGDRKVRKKLSQISEEIDDIHTMYDDVVLINNEADDLCFFPVENSKPKANRAMIQNLRSAIQKLLNSPPDLAKQVIWKKEVPLSWLFFMGIVDSKQKNISSFSEMYEFGKEKGFSGTEMKQLLKFFTEAGTIVSFQKRFSKLDAEAELLDDTVLKPKWLLKSLACFLFDDIHKKNIKALKQLKGMKTMVKLLRNGFLSKLLFTKILEFNKCSKREIRFLEQLCRIMLVLSPVDQVPELLKEKVNLNSLGQHSFWLLPSMLNSSVLSNDLVRGAEMISINWQTTTPLGLFERFICSFLRHSIGKEGVELHSVSSNSAVLKLRRVEIQLQKEDWVKFNVLFNSNDQSVLNVIHVIVQEVLQDVKNLDLAVPLRPKIDCTVPLDMPKKELSLVLPTDQPKSVLEWDFDCFLSHSWGDYPDFETHQQVLRIAADLKHEGFKVWVDANELNATVAGELHRGIDGSACFIAFVTKKYLKSADDRDNNAGKEFNYAALKNGADSIVPVLLDPEFRNPKDWRGNVGIHLGNALYVDFSSAEAQDENMNSLCVRIKKLSMRKRQMRKIDQ